MAPPVSPNHSMSTPFSPQIRNKDIGKAHTVNVSPRMPAASFSTAATTVWQVDKTKASSKPKPKRPYTPYNLFYLLERELVVQNINGPPKHTAAKRKPAGIAPREEDQIKPSSRYDGIVMAPYWYDPNMKEKRKHRKTQGMIPFKELTGIISANWAKVDEETKDYVSRISELGRNRYKEEMNRFNASQKIKQLQKAHANMAANAATKMGNNLKRYPIATKTVQVGSPVQRNMASLKAKPMPVTPDRTISNLPTIAHKPSPPVVTPHIYPHQNFPSMYPHIYGIPLPPPMPAPMSLPPNMPPLYQRRPRQFECNRPVKKASKKDPNSKVEKDAIITSSREAVSHDDALHLCSLMDDEFMNFEPDHNVTEHVFEEGNTAAFTKGVEDEDILDMIKGDSWNMNMDHFNYDEDPFPFLAD